MDMPLNWCTAVAEWKMSNESRARHRIISLATVTLRHDQTIDQTTKVNIDKK